MYGEKIKAPGQPMILCERIDGDLDERRPKPKRALSDDPDAQFTPLGKRKLFFQFCMIMFFFFTSRRFVVDIRSLDQSWPVLTFGLPVFTRFVLPSRPVFTRFPFPFFSRNVFSKRAVLTAILFQPPIYPFRNRFLRFFESVRFRSVFNHPISSRFPFFKKEERRKMERLRSGRFQKRAETDQDWFGCLFPFTVPELCWLTGISDDLKTNFSNWNKVLDSARKEPKQRADIIRDFAVKLDQSVGFFRFFRFFLRLNFFPRWFCFFSFIDQIYSFIY